MPTELKPDYKAMLEDIGMTDRLVQRMEALERLEQRLAQVEQHIHDEILHPEIAGHRRILHLWEGLDRTLYECANFQYCPLPGRPIFLQWDDKRYDYKPESHAQHRELALLLDRFGPPEGYAYIAPKCYNKIFGLKECVEHTCTHPSLFK